MLQRSLAARVKYPEKAYSVVAGPYHDENTRSRPISEVKHRRAGIVLGWGTAWELPVAWFFWFVSDSGNTFRASEGFWNPQSVFHHQGNRLETLQGTSSRCPRRQGKPHGVVSRAPRVRSKVHFFTGQSGRGRPWRRQRWRLVDWGEPRARAPRALSLLLEFPRRPKPLV